MMPCLMINKSNVFSNSSVPNLNLFSFDLSQTAYLDFMKLIYRKLCEYLQYIKLIVYKMECAVLNSPKEYRKITKPPGFILVKGLGW